jgi:hypothetical protein
MLVDRRKCTKCGTFITTYPRIIAGATPVKGKVGKIGKM